MFSSLNNDGRMAIVLDTGAVSRGSGNTGSNRERDIRKEFVEHDLIESVILLPENLFYNTPAPGIIMVLNKNKIKKDQVLLINASKIFKKGRPKNFLPDETIKEISDIYLNWKEKESISKVVKKEEITKNDYNLSPSRYVSQNNEDNTLPLEDAIVQVKEVEEETQAANKKMKEVLEQIGFEL
jgi:type I restriction enzyme M protein